MPNFRQSLTLVYILYFVCTLACQKTQWQCNDGQCIELDQRCDGKPDCSDGSDETARHCISIHCPSFAFRCAYGGCISGKYKCNKRQDCADNSDETTLLCLQDHDEIRRRVRGRCSENSNSSIQCLSGECIENYNLCDGIPDCADGSDETVQMCSHLFCPSFAFRCGYGGCIGGKSKCNGVKDCVDGSDESAELCGYENNQVGNGTTTIVKMKSQNCTIPFNRQHLIVENQITRTRIQLGESVPTGTLVKFTCSANCQLNGNDFSVCVGGKWQHGVANCDKYDNQSTTAEDSYHNKQVHNCTEEDEWDTTKRKCTAQCGLASDLCGLRTWQVSIFRRTIRPEFHLVCEGSIISPKMVITAAVCITSTDAVFYNIVEGQYGNGYKQGADIGMRLHNVSEIAYDEGEPARSSIVILVLINHFTFRNNLQPICFVFNLVGSLQSSPYDLTTTASAESNANECNEELLDVRSLKPALKTWYLSSIVVSDKKKIHIVKNYDRFLQRQLQRYDRLL